MIRLVIQRGTELDVRDEDGRQIASIGVGYGTELEGWSEEGIVLRNGNHVYTVDERGYQMGFLNLSESTQRVSGVTSAGFSIRNRNHVQTYDFSCRAGDSYQL